MNVTLALDDDLVARAREKAREQGKSLNDLIRAYLESVAGRRSADESVRLLEQLWAEDAGHSGGVRITREDAYEGRT